MKKGEAKKETLSRLAGLNEKNFRLLTTSRSPSYGEQHEEETKEKKKESDVSDEKNDQVVGKGGTRACASLSEKWGGNGRKRLVRKKEKGRNRKRTPCTEGHDRAPERGICV